MLKARSENVFKGDGVVDDIDIDILIPAQGKCLFTYPINLSL